MFYWDQHVGAIAKKKTCVNYDFSEIFYGIFPDLVKYILVKSSWKCHFNKESSFE